MNRRPFPALRLAVLTLCCTVSAVAIATEQSKHQASAIEIAFTVSMPKPHTHMLEVEINVKRAAGAQVSSEETLVLPVWTPGSYLVREYARNVQNFRAIDAAGQPLQWEKVNK